MVVKSLKSKVSLMLVLQCIEPYCMENVLLSQSNDVNILDFQYEEEALGWVTKNNPHEVARVLFLLKENIIKLDKVDKLDYCDIAYTLQPVSNGSSSKTKQVRVLDAYDRINKFKKLLDKVSNISLISDILDENSAFVIGFFKKENEIEYNVGEINPSNDEISSMSNSMNSLICSVIQRLQDFGLYTDIKLDYDLINKDLEFSLRKYLMKYRTQENLLKKFEEGSDDFEIAFFSCYQILEQIKSYENGFELLNGEKIIFGELIQQLVEELNELFETYDLDSLKKVQSVVECFNFIKLSKNSDKLIIEQLD